MNLRHSLLPRFAVDGIIGQGAQGRVYRARDTLCGRDVAVKIAGDDAPASPEVLSAAENEIESQRAVRHHAVLEVMAKGITDSGHPYFVTELLEGVTLANAIATTRGMAVPAFLALAQRIAAALTAIHEAGVVHRDLKPENLFLCKNGRVVVLDFGLASSPRGARRRASHPCGTVHFMAPELLDDRLPSQASDIYSLGATFFFLLTGETLLGDGSLFDCLTELANRQRKTLARRGHRYDLVQLVERMLAASETRRPTAREVRDQLALMAEPSGRADLAAWIKRVTAR